MTPPPCSWCSGAAFTKSTVSSVCWVTSEHIPTLNDIICSQGVRSAYVTTLGRLIGVVGLKELRKAIEDANSGNIPRRGHSGEDGEMNNPANSGENEKFVKNE